MLPISLANNLLRAPNFVKGPQILILSNQSFHYDPKTSLPRYSIIVQQTFPDEALDFLKVLFLVIKNRILHLNPDRPKSDSSQQRPQLSHFVKPPRFINSDNATFSVHRRSVPGHVFTFFFNSINCSCESEHLLEPKIVHSDFLCENGSMTIGGG